MHMIVASYVNGDVVYYGPFPTHARALEYGAAFYVEARQPSRWHITALVIPHTVVKNIEWRQ